MNHIVKAENSNFDGRGHKRGKQKTLSRKRSAEERRTGAILELCKEIEKSIAVKQECLGSTADPNDMELLSYEDWICDKIFILASYTDSLSDTYCSESLSARHTSVVNNLTKELQRVDDLKRGELERQANQSRSHKESIDTCESKNSLMF